MLLTLEELIPSTEPVAAEAHAHETINHFLVKRADVGIDGLLDLGTLLEWIDFVAHSTATQWCSGNCAAASVGNIHLDRPIRVGELVEVRAALVYTDRDSMHILITVHCSDPDRTMAPQTAQCAVVFVALDGAGDLAKVADWTPLTMLELQRHRQARLRMRTRRGIEDAMAAETYSAQGTAPSATLRFRVASTDIDSDGNVRGGRVMRWLDEAGYACGVDWVGTDVVTSYVAGVRLRRVIFVGDVVDVTARIIHTGRRSIHIGIRAVTADAAGQPLLVAQGVIVVVSLGVHGEAQPVAQWQPVSDEDRRLDRHARHLIELRQYLEPYTAATT